MFVSTCMHICIYIYMIDTYIAWLMCTYMYIHIYIYICTVHLDAGIHANMHVYTHGSQCMSIYIHVHVSLLHAVLYVCDCGVKCRHLYIHVCIYVYMHIDL